MKIKNLNLRNYRNYKKLDIEFSPGLNIFIGKNAQGKSNILESIFVLALTKSYMNIKDENLIKRGEEFSSLKAVFFNDIVEEQLEVSISKNSKKLKLNHYEVKCYSDYISRVKALVFSPYNVNFVKDGPNIRRKSINMVMSQFYNVYVKKLQSYNAILKKRNQFLKTVDFSKNFNNFYLESLNLHFVSLAVDIVLAREQFIERINAFLPKIYSEIMGFDGLKLVYVSNIERHVDKNFMLKQLLSKFEFNLEREKLMGMTLSGPHRDDFIFILGDKELSVYGSQGQIRAAILALKLAEVLLFKEETGEYPILLLDDIFSELDVEKRNRLVKYILEDVQTIITTTDINMIEPLLIEKAKVFTVENGIVVTEGKKECKDE